MNTLLTLLAVALLGLLVINLRNHRINKDRTRLIDESRRRVETRKSEDAFKSSLVKHTDVVEYSTDFSGLEVTDLSEEQADVIRKIFDNQRPAIKHRDREHVKDFWATTSPGFLS